MKLLKRLHAHRQELRASDVFPVTHMVSDTVFATDNARIGMVIKVEGVSFITEEPAQLNVLSQSLHKAITSLDSRFMVYVTTQRRQVSTCLKGNFKSKFAKDADKRYQDRFKKGAFYANDTYISVLYDGGINAEKGSKGVLAKLQKILPWKTDSHGAVDESLKLSAECLEEKVEQLQSLLKAFKPQILSGAEIAEFLSIVPNGGRPAAIKEDSNYPVTANSYADLKERHTKYPLGHMGGYLCRSRLLFGTHIQVLKEGGEAVYAAMLSAKRYPTETGSIILDPLLSIDSAFVSTHTFSPMRQDKALSTVSQTRNKLTNAEDLAFSQQADLEVLEDGVASEEVVLGAHQHTLMLLSDDIESLEEKIKEATRLYSLGGFGVIKETIGMEASFWSQIPGNSHFQTRQALITSKNFCDFCSLHAYKSGYENQNHLGSALTLFETPSKTPVYFNLHTKGSKTNPSKGHALIIGGNGSGKNVLASHLDMQLGRYDNRTFFLERNQASKIYVLASGNSEYYVISPDETGNLSLNPLQLPDSPSNRTFLKDWFSHLILRPGETGIVGKIKESISECIDYAFEQLDASQRNLSNVSKLLPVDFPRWPELRAWLGAFENSSAGQFSWIFDNPKDSMSLDLDKVGFDVTYLMDSVGEHISTPVYMYLLHRMRERIEDKSSNSHRLTTIVIDEFWQVLKSPYWNDLLEDWLPTIRKQNAHFIFMTQSASTVLESSISRQVLDNLASLLLFGNPRATQDDYVRGLDLTESEFQVIKENSPDSRLFLFKQDLDSMICRFDISDMAEEVRIYSANQRSVNLLDEIIKEKGRDPHMWIDEFKRRSAA